MKFLLDTHALLWWLAKDVRLSKPANEAIRDPSNFIFVSAATAWEISIKQALGKLHVPHDLEEALQFNEFQSLPLAISHALLVGQLPPHHDDPFDRALIAQAKIEGLTLITRDHKLKLYDISILIA